jgi:dipeptidyl aminopeptidase/acylaminoacyl peptidase
MRHTSILSFLFVSIVATTPGVSHAASEIWYGKLATIRNTTAYITYQGPSGQQNFACTISNGKCKKASVPQLPKIGNTQTYEISPRGNYGITTTASRSRTYYTLYDIRNKKPKKVALIPHTLKGSAVRFSDQEDAVIFIGPGPTAARYAITNNQYTTVALSQTDLPFRAINETGTFMSAYNYGTSGHTLWNLQTGSEKKISGTGPSYAEVSQNGAWVAYAKEVDGFRSLYLSSTAAPGTRETAVTAKPAVIEDYVFVGDTLYYLANVDDPYSWDLFAFNPSSGQKRTIATDVSYGEYLSRASGMLAFVKVIGTTAQVHVYDPVTEKTQILAGIRSGTPEDTIARSSMRIGPTHAVLLSPEKSTSDTLVVWLHGGPERQAAIGYHPYLSYAVYDELLEKIAASGAYVLKLDYTGSTGYGTAFQKGLYLKIGDVDVNDIERAVAEMKRRYPSITKTHLIGNSYGGYLALKGINDAPSEYGGAISINGVTDWYGLISRIPSSPFKTLFEGVPDDHNLAAYKQASVFTNLEKLDKQTKVLVAYGTEDATVPTWQSKQYLDFAKAKRIPVTALELASEEHVIRKRKSLDRLCSAVKATFTLSAMRCGI